MAQETWVQSQVESYQRLKKWYLMPPCLTLSIIRYGSRVKWSNPWKGVVPSPTPWCSSYRKGNLWVAFDYGTFWNRKNEPVSDTSFFFITSVRHVFRLLDFLSSEFHIELSHPSPTNRYCIYRLLVRLNYTILYGFPFSTNHAYFLYQIILFVPDSCINFIWD